MKKSLLSLVVISALSSSVMAADVRVSGFLNVIGGMNDLDSNDATTSNSYRGYTDQYDFQNESLAAIQISGNISDNMGATVQIIAQNQAVGDNVRLEWGYAYLDLNDETRVLAGRIRPTLFLYSDYLDVGYAYNWVTPPSEVYDQANITNLDGASIAYNLELGDNTLSTTLYGGNSSKQEINPNDTTTPLELSFDSVVGMELAFITEYGKIRAGYIQANITESTTLATAPAGLQMNESSAAFYSIGANIDYEDILFSAEYISRDMDETGSPDVTSYYAMLGYKLGDFTPSYTYAVADSEMTFSTTGTPVDGPVNTVRSGNLDDRSSHTLGLRYDINSAAAFKVEYNMATLTHSTYVGTTTLRETDEDINTYRIALNVVF